MWRPRRHYGPQARHDRVGCRTYRTPNCMGLAADVSNRADMERLVAIVRERFGRLDVVVANAAVGANARLGEITEEKLSKVIGTNLLGVVHTVQAALPLMKPGGSVILVGPTASHEAPVSMSVYGAAKAGLGAFTKTWIKDLQGRGIRLGAVRDESRIQALAAKSPLGRIGSIDEVANVVTFFASDFASYVNGTELYVDGGLRV